MKTIKIGDVHASMLKEVGRRWKMTETDLLEKLIQETYSSKTTRRWKYSAWVPATSRGNQIRPLYRVLRKNFSGWVERPVGRSKRIP